MIDKKQLNVRIPIELFNQITDTGLSKAQIVVDALQLYFNSYSYQSDIKTIDSLLNQLKEKDNQIAAKDKQISEIHILLQNAMNLKAIDEPDHDPRPWWKFWCL